MAKLEEVTEERRQLILNYIDEHVTNGDQTINDLCRQLDIKRNAFYKIKQGKIKKIRAKTWLAIESMIKSEQYRYLDKGQIFSESEKWRMKYEAIKFRLELAEKMIERYKNRLKAIDNLSKVLVKSCIDDIEETTVIS